MLYFSPFSGFMWYLKPIKNKVICKKVSGFCYKTLHSLTLLGEMNKGAFQIISH